MAIKSYGRLGAVIDVNPGDLELMVRDRRLFFVVCLMSPPRLGTRLFMTTLEYRYFAPHTSAEKNFQVYTLRWQGLSFCVLCIPASMRQAAEKVARLTRMRIADGTPTMIDAKREGAILMPKVTRFPLDTRQVWTLEYNTKTHPLYVERPLTRARLEELVADERRQIDEVYRRYGAPGHLTEAEIDFAFEVEEMQWEESVGDYADALIEEWPDVLG
jgi:hypothetical protein